MIGAEADLETQRIILTSGWADKDRIKSLPGSRWNTAQKFWTMPLSWAACLSLRGELGNQLTIGSCLKEWAQNERKSRVDPANALRGLLALGADQGLIQKSWKDSTQFNLFDYQIAGAEFLVTAGSALLADDMGVGKTATAISTIRLLSDKREDPYPALVVCPNSVGRNWAREIKLWLPGATPYLLTGTVLNRRKVLKAAAEDSQAVVIVNIEGVRSLSRLAPYGSIRLLKCLQCDKQEGTDIPSSRCEVHPKELNNFGFRTCVLDEGHRVKDPKSKQTRAVWSVFHGSTVLHRYALTGTPIANHPGDLWSIMHAIAPEDFQRRSAFIERYAHISYNAYGMEIHGLNKEHSAELFGFLDPRMRRVTKAQVLPQLPEKMFITREVELSPKQRKIYDQLINGSAAELDTGDILTVATNLTLSTRLLQLASSTCSIEYGDDPDDYSDWKVTMNDPSSKIDELMEIIAEMNGKPMVVAAEHRRLLDLAGARLEKAGITHRMITGAVDARQRDLNMDDFNNNVAQVLMFTYKAGGVGLNMTHSDTLVRIQRSWSLVDHKQGEDRIYRIGSDRHESITIIDIIAADTIEQDQLEALQRKTERLEEINRDEDK